MSLLINKNSRVMIQGITGSSGSFFTEQMLKNGVKIVAGVSPGRGGDWVLQGKVPVFDTVDAAVEITGADTCIMFVPPKNVYDALMEAISAQIPLIFCITGKVPCQDVIRIKTHLKNQSIRIIGPGSPGMISPENICIGAIPSEVSKKGTIGVISRSGPLAFEILFEMAKAGLGISAYVGIGSNAMVFSNYSDILESFELDPSTEKILIIGESGTLLEQKAAEFISENITKPVVGYVAGNSLGNYKNNQLDGKSDLSFLGIEEKISSFRSAGVKLATLPQEIPALLREI